MPLDTYRVAAWYRCSRWLNVLVVSTVATAWALRDGSNSDGFISPALFWGLVVTSIFALYVTAYTTDRKLLNKSWTFVDIIRQAFWRTLFPTVSLLLVAVCFEDFYSHRISGVLWLILAGIVAMVGAYRLRVAQGMKLRRVKSGEMYKRAMVLAKETNTLIKRVYIVPAGRGHLTNAFGMSQSIAITDNYGKFLRGPELDSVIGHELGHVKGRHSRKRLISVVILYGTLSVLALLLPRSLVHLRPCFDVLVIFLPVLALNFIARKFEYDADRAAADLAGTKVAIQALRQLYEMTQIPADCNRVVELFMSHPSLSNRIRALHESGVASLAATSG